MTLAQKRPCVHVWPYQLSSKPNASATESTSVEPGQPTFEDGVQNQKVLAAVEKSSKTRRWVKV